MRVRYLVAGALLFGGAVVAGVATAQSIEDERRALAVAKAQSFAADQRAARLEQLAAVQTSAAEAANSQAAAVASRIQSAEAEISAAEARVAIIDRLRAEARSRLLAKQEPAIKLIAALQLMTRRPPALALVQPGSLTDLVHVRAVLSAIMPVLRARTASLRAELEQSRRLRKDADQALLALNAGQKRLVSERASLVQLATIRRRESQSLSGSAIIEQDRAMALGEKARDIVSLMSDINAGAEVRAQLETLSGPVLRPTRPGDPRATPIEVATLPQVRLPYRLPVAGTVITGLGEVSDAGVRARGLTIATRSQAQVVSPAAGRIAYAGPFRGFGQIVIVDHGRRWTTLITSLSALDVRVGDIVVQGGPIGRAGNDRPTVTVELRRDNQPIDITPFVAG